MRKTPIAKDLDLTPIAEATYFWTVAELEKLVKKASALAMDEETDLVGYKHFMDAIKTFEVNVNERIKNIQDMRSKLERLENVNRKFLQDSLRAFKEKERKDDPPLKGLVEDV